MDDPKGTQTYADTGREGRVLTIDRLIRLIRVWRWSFLCTFVIAAALIVTWAFIATPQYRVSVKAMPRSNTPDALGSGMGGLLAGIGGLAGLGLGGADEQEAIAWLKSRALFEVFLQNENLMPVLFAAAWDSKSQRWKSDLKRIPTADDAWGTFDRIRRVNQDTRTRMVTVEIAWKDRYQAAAWANELVRLTNEQMRQRALLEAQASLRSLQEQLNQAEAVELKQSIYHLMDAQVNRIVIAKSRPDYALNVIDPAVVPDREKYASPHRGLMIIMAIPFGLAVASSLVVMLQALSSLFRRFSQPMHP
jgi:hypothetical protein